MTSLITIIKVILLLFLIVCAIAVSFTKKMLPAVITFMSYSVVMSIIWFMLESPDLAVTEAAVGAGVTSVLFFVTLKKLHSIDKEEEWEKKEVSQYRAIGFFRKVWPVVGILTACVMIAVLMAAVLAMPALGEADAVRYNEVTERYLVSGVEETAAVNIVTGMILDYRAFDTFGESCVLFIASCCVLILLRADTEELKKEEEVNDRKYEPHNDVISQKIIKLLVPILFVFGIYIILNGHLSPGGGFSGGAIIGASLILYANAFGFVKVERFFTEKTFKTITVIALSFYCFAKSYSFYTGGNHIESIIPKGIAGNILSSGLILPLNICVGLVVTCTMYAFYTLFRRGKI